MITVVIACVSESEFIDIAGKIGKVLSDWSNEATFIRVPGPVMFATKDHMAYMMKPSITTIGVLESQFLFLRLGLKRKLEEATGLPVNIS